MDTPLYNSKPVLKSYNSQAEYRKNLKEILEGVKEEAQSCICKSEM